MGELSSSALSTATAVSAISATLIHDRDAIEDPPAMERLVIGGMQYLVGQANPDGGFGDTDRSHSNIATSYLVLAANRLAAQALDAGALAGQQHFSMAKKQVRPTPSPIDPHRRSTRKS